MITAIVVMNCEVGKVHSVAETLTHLDGVKYDNDCGNDG